MDEVLQNQWDKGGEFYPNWEINSWDEGSTIPLQSNSKPSVPTLFLDEPVAIGQEWKTWCWAAALQIWQTTTGLGQINRSLSQAEIVDIFKEKGFLTPNEGLKVNTAIWSEVASFFGANRRQFFRPDNQHKGLTAEFLFNILRLKAENKSSGYIIVAENEPGSPYKHAYIIYGIDMDQDPKRPWWAARDPDGARLGSCPIGRSPTRWSTKFDVGATSEYWLAWMEN